MLKEEKHCECGCGQIVKKRFIRGHSWRRAKTEQEKESMRKNHWSKRMNLWDNPKYRERRRFSKESLEKMRSVRLGRHYPKLSEAKKGKPPWNKGKKCPQFLGENNPNWYGGLSFARILIWKSEQYKQWRIAVFKRDNYTCQFCGQHTKLNADHIKPFSKYPELRFDINNGRTLCVSCHKKTDTYGVKVLRT